MLTRLACSDIHQRHYSSQTERPIDIDPNDLRLDENRRDASLVFYCRHVVSELQDFYPDEYDMLELLSLGQIRDFLDFASYPEYSNHLKSYGLIQEELPGVPSIAIPVIARYVALDEARRDGRRTILQIVPEEDRSRWYRQRMEQILSDIGQLEKLAVADGGEYIYGPNSVPDSHKLMECKPVSREQEFSVFVVTVNICLVEGIEKYGKHVGVSDYFWKTIRVTYPELFNALHRIRVYRNKASHAALNANVEAAYQDFMHKDLEGRHPQNVEEVWFILQQCIVDSLHSSLQFEISRLGR